MISGRFGIRRLLRFGPLVLGTLVLAGCGTPVTYGTGVPTTLQTVRDFTDALTFGDRSDPIVYEERPDLVIPPNTDLPLPTDPPPPAAQVAAVAADPCQWWQLSWSAVGPETRQALVRLGWNEASWQSADPSAWPASAAKSWDGLRPGERRGAEALGFTQPTWDTCGLP